MPSPEPHGGPLEPESTVDSPSGTLLNTSAPGALSGANTNGADSNGAATGTAAASEFDPSAFNGSEYATGSPKHPSAPGPSAEDYAFETAAALAAAPGRGGLADLPYAYAGVGPTPVPAELRPVIVSAPEDITPKVTAAGNSSGGGQGSDSTGGAAGGGGSTGGGGTAYDRSASGGAGLAAPGPGAARRLRQADAAASPAPARSPRLTTAMKPVSTMAAPAAAGAGALPPLPFYLSPNFTGLAAAVFPVVNGSVAAAGNTSAPAAVTGARLNTTYDAAPPLLPVPSGNPVRPGDLPQDLGTAAAVAAGGKGGEGTTNDPVPAPVKFTANGLIVQSADVSVCGARTCGGEGWGRGRGRPPAAPGAGDCVPPAEQLLRGQTVQDSVRCRNDSSCA